MGCTRHDFGMENVTVLVCCRSKDLCCYSGNICWFESLPDIENDFGLFQSLHYRQNERISPLCRGIYIFHIRTVHQLQFYCVQYRLNYEHHYRINSTETNGATSFCVCVAIAAQIPLLQNVTKSVEQDCKFDFPFARHSVPKCLCLLTLFYFKVK